MAVSRNDCVQQCLHVTVSCNVTSVPSYVPCYWLKESNGRPILGCDDEISESDLTVKALKHMAVLKGVTWKYYKSINPSCFCSSPEMWNRIQWKNLLNWLCMACLCMCNSRSSFHFWGYITFVINLCIHKSLNAVRELYFACFSFVSLEMKYQVRCIVRYSIPYSKWRSGYSVQKVHSLLTLNSNVNERK